MKPKLYTIHYSLKNEREMPAFHRRLFDFTNGCAEAGRFFRFVRLTVYAIEPAFQVEEVQYVPEGAA